MRDGIQGVKPTQTFIGEGVGDDYTAAVDARLDINGDMHIDRIRYSKGQSHIIATPEGPDSTGFYKDRSRLFAEETIQTAKRWNDPPYRDPSK